ncbi:hypothetical protein M8C21_001980 [Ambrosia artemisiifolia]|uniref:Small nuclear ribonucleoprotein E n=1 Tax=Ambrosia artemisiifolia TaxID=4212 RepID=A0AAD5C027_AMBAR|nr:hypothetical protein M8C21_001980 [Ambrosia artemisiifolia]
MKKKKRIKGAGCILQRRVSLDCTPITLLGFSCFYDCVINQSTKKKTDNTHTAATMATKVQRIMTQPINLIFRFLQSKARIQIWLFEQKDLRIEGRIIGFDEYMNLVLDEAEEVSIKKKTRKALGRILLKGDNITLMMNAGK